MEGLLRKVQVGMELFCFESWLLFEDDVYFTYLEEAKL
jgi:hypothetical protein